MEKETLVIEHIQELDQEEEEELCINIVCNEPKKKTKKKNKKAKKSKQVISTDVSNEPEVDHEVVLVRRDTVTEMDVDVLTDQEELEVTLVREDTKEHIEEIEVPNLTAQNETINVEAADTTNYIEEVVVETNTVDFATNQTPEQENQTINLTKNEEDSPEIPKPKLSAIPKPSGKKLAPKKFENKSSIPKSQGKKMTPKKTPTKLPSKNSTISPSKNSTPVRAQSQPRMLPKNSPTKLSIKPKNSPTKISTTPKKSQQSPSKNSTPVRAQSEPKIVPTKPRTPQNEIVDDRDKWERLSHPIICNRPCCWYKRDLANGHQRPTERAVTIDNVFARISNPYTVPVKK